MKNGFIDQITEIPNAKTIRSQIMLLLPFFVYLNYYVIKWFFLTVRFSEMELFFFSVYLFTLIVTSTVLFFFPRRFRKLIFLFTSLSFFGSSVLYMYITTVTLLFVYNLDAIFYILMILLGYFLAIFSVIKNMMNKINYGARSFISDKKGSSVALICGVIGVTLGKLNLISNDILGHIAPLILLSYVYTFFIVHFYVFYLSLTSKDLTR